MRPSYLSWIFSLFNYCLIIAFKNVDIKFCIRYFIIQFTCGSCSCSYLYRSSRGASLLTRQLHNLYFIAQILFYSCNLFSLSTSYCDPNLLTWYISCLYFKLIPSNIYLKITSVLESRSLWNIPLSYISNPSKKDIPFNAPKANYIIYIIALNRL